MTSCSWWSSQGIQSCQFDDSFVKHRTMNEDQIEILKISFVQSQKGRPLVVSDNYIYKLNKSTTSTKYWICSMSTCTAKIHTGSNDQFVRMIDEHSHSAEKENVDLREFREKVKQRAISETTSITRMYDEECSKALLTTATIAVLPSEHEMSEMISLSTLDFDFLIIDSAVNKAHRAITPNIPTTQLFDIPDPFTNTLRGNNFLVIDKFITTRQRMLLFASADQLKMLFTVDTILMDGTFSSCPKIFDQVYTIHNVRFEQCKRLVSSVDHNDVRTSLCVCQHFHVLLDYYRTDSNRYISSYSVN